MRVFISDCEGPISKNDNAFEITAHFLPRGDYFFSLVSKYDDVLADVVKRPGYRAGYTLKLITPFLKAYGVTNKKVEEYSAENIILIRGARETLQQAMEAMPSFIVSTSYAQYISVLCARVGFPYENVYCTKLDMDKHPIDKVEALKLKQLRKEIAALPMIEIPKGARSMGQLSEQSREVVRRLDRVFWEEVPSMAVGGLLEEVKPVGGEEKAEAVREISEKVGCGLGEAMYVGDSITDVQAFQIVKEGGGLTVSFNGNEYAVRNAEVAVLSENAIVTAVLAEVFSKLGREGVLELVEEWNSSALRRYCSDKKLLKIVSSTYSEKFSRVEHVTRDNVDRLVEESSSFRKTVRGEAIGKLG